MIDLIAGLILYVVDSTLGLVRRGLRFVLHPVASIRSRSDRFVALANRAWASDLGLSTQLAAAIQRSKWNTDNHRLPPINWKGARVVKDPFGMSALPMLIWELRPLTIIEIGALDGGSALWLADLLEVMEIDGHVYSYDIDIQRIDVHHPRVTFAHIDARDVSSFPRELFANLPHPWLVIEDAHQNVYKLLRFFDSYMHSGDYFLIEDTIDWRKHRKMQRFVSDASGVYEVDTRYTDLFGYNVTWNINGYLRRR